MPVRTSTVVAGGLTLLAIVGVTTIFGESLLAVVAPPPTELASVTAAGKGPSEPPSAGGATKPAAAGVAPAGVSPGAAGGAPPHNN